MNILPQDSCKSYFFAGFKPKKSASLISFDAHQLFSSYIKKSLPVRLRFPYLTYIDSFLHHEEDHQ